MTAERLALFAPMLRPKLLLLSLLIAGASGTGTSSRYLPRRRGGACHDVEQGATDAANREAEDDVGLLQLRAGLAGKDVVSKQVATTAGTDLEEDGAGSLSESCSTLTNEGTYFTIAVDVGKPKQRFALTVDTGSNDLIIPDCVCTIRGLCGSTDDTCFNPLASSTFSMPTVHSKKAPKDEMVLTYQITFGSGTITSVLASEVVNVAGIETLMNGSVQLMEDRRFLDIEGSFQGIFPLGLPQPNETLDTYASRGWAQIAKVSRYTVCYNGGSAPGKFVVDVPEFPNAFESIGKDHWGLDLQGMSVGNASAPALFCTPSSKKEGMETACGAVPDSGTTFMVGPKEQVLQLFDSICDEWPRCKNAALKSSKGRRLVFHELLRDCDDWLTTESGLEEIPPIQLHLAGKDGKPQRYHLTPYAFIVETTAETVRKVTINLFGFIPLSFDVPTGNRVRTCLAAIDTIDYYTKLNGPVWILGQPLFLDYTVGFDIGKQPGAISIMEEPCTECSSKPSLLSPGLRDRSGVMLPRRIDGPLRKPITFKGSRL